MFKAVAPIIIIGMHRSGTSMLSRILEQQGLFLGKTKGRAENNESKLFRLFNNWLFDQAGARWDEPVAWQLWLSNDRARQSSVAFIEKMLRSPRSAGYLGWLDYLRYRSPAALDRAWGWKDPLNTFTLPIWLELFPSARVIHIVRNGVDVAESLRRRSERQLADLDLWLSKMFRQSALVRSRLPTKVMSLRCLEVEGGFELWQTYLYEAANQLELLSANQKTTVRFEDFLQSPQVTIRGLCEFCDLPVSKDELQNLEQTIDHSRAFAFREAPELSAFYKSVRSSAQMIAFGYSEIGV